MQTVDGMEILPHALGFYRAFESKKQIPCSSIKGFEKTSSARLDSLSKPQRTMVREDFERLA